MYKRTFLLRLYVKRSVPFVQIFGRYQFSSIPFFFLSLIFYEIIIFVPDTYRVVRPDTEHEHELNRVISLSPISLIVLLLHKIPVRIALYQGTSSASKKKSYDTFFILSHSISYIYIYICVSSWTYVQIIHNSSLSLLYLLYSYFSI